MMICCKTVVTKQVTCYYSALNFMTIYGILNQLDLNWGNLTHAHWGVTFMSNNVQRD